MKSLIKSIYTEALRSLYTEAFKKRVKLLAVLRCVYTFCGCSENFYSVFIKELCQLYRSLSAESHNNAYGLFNTYDIHDVLGRERLKVKSVGSIIVGRNGFGVIVDYYNVITHFLKSPYAVNGRVVKLYTLSYTDGTRAEHHYDRLSAAFKRSCLTGLVICRIEIRCLCVKLCTAGINHFVNGIHRRYTGKPERLFDRFTLRIKSEKSYKCLIRVPEPLALPVKLIKLGIFTAAAPAGHTVGGAFFQVGGF